MQRWLQTAGSAVGAIHSSEVRLLDRAGPARAALSQLS